MMTRRAVGVVILFVLIGVFAGWRLTHDPVSARAADSTPPPRVPVITATTQVQDVPVYLDGLGTVQAFNIVEIKAQANGTLISLPTREGQEIHKGDIVAEIDPRPYQAALDQAMAQRSEDIALLQSAQLDLRRFQSLAKSSFAPIQQVDDQQATVNKEIAAVALDNASIETAQINLGYCTVRAPIDGRISLYQTDVGNLIEVTSQTNILSITQDKPISVVFTLPEADLPQIQAARSKGPVAVEAFDSQRNTPPLASGTLLTPNNTIDTTTGTISLKAIFDNKDDHLWPGQFVNARVRIATLEHSVTVPVLAVQHGPNGLFVYAVKSNNEVDQVNVQVGYQDDDLAVVSQGLSGNETVVVSGQSRLAPGTRVAATAASKAAHPPATGTSSTASAT